MQEINPWGSEDVKDYDKIMKDFGISPFTPLVKKIRNPHYLMKRGIIFGHRDFERILEAIEKKKEFAMMTGLMPSGKFHLGHKLLADQIIYYQQELGAKIFLCVADIEAYNMRLDDLDKLKDIAINEYLINYIALGLKPKSCDFYFQSNRSIAYYKLADMVARKVTFNELKDIYGELSPGKIISVMTQAADILHPQLEEYGGSKPVVVPVGIDQDPHIRLTRDIAARFEKEFKFIPPSSTYHFFMHGIKGGKMSSSDPNSYIALTDTPEDIDRKVKNMLTGGKESVELQRKEGGDPDKCVVFEIYKFHLLKNEEDVKKLYNDCKTGKILCGECKARLKNMLKEFLEEHQKKREKAKDMVHKFVKE
ncbi:MAG: tryptophan--tRNA ligase [Candidatus Aenigmarchaeota archaeon]|nr:tryptophan--tRNA ligase [Candidatus Aenigmarchaeota archaeon]